MADEPQDGELVDVIVLEQSVFTKDEWKQVALLVRPDLGDEEYDAMWANFIEMKRTHGIHRVK